jgi:hypothetical protein
MQSQMEPAPKSSESFQSEDSSKQQRQRRRRQRDQPVDETSSGNANEGISANNPARTSSKPKRSKRKDSSDSSKGGGSVVWTILVIGIVFCLCDVAYIIGFVERQQIVSWTEIRPVENAATIIKDQTEPKIAAVDRQLDNKYKGGDKQPILNLLASAGHPIDPIEDKEIYDELPTWQEVVDLYGSKPVIYGLEICEKFQAQSDPAEHFVSTAGTFNTGTNLMAELLIANCHMQKRMDKYGFVNRGVRWQVPWYVKNSLKALLF